MKNTLSLSLWLILFLAMFSPPAVCQDMTHLVYEGELLQIGKRGEKVPVKKFQLDCFVIPQHNQRQVVYLIDENGGGGHHWPEQFGELILNANHQQLNKRKMGILYNHNDTQHQLGLRQCYFEFHSKMKTDETWLANNLRHTVGRKKTIGSRSCRQIQIFNNFGLVQSCYVDEAAGLLVEVEHRLTMGQGDPFRIQMNLKSGSEVDQAEAKQLSSLIPALLALQAQLDREQDPPSPLLSEEQVQHTQKALSELKKLSAKTSFRSLVDSIANDLELQQLRIEGVKGLSARFLNKKAAKFALTSMSGKTIPTKEYQNQILLLHFWSYKNKPLKEPYGQVGYLDFLNQQGKRRKYGLKVYGIAVNDDLGVEEKKGAALRSIRQLREFFNLGYPVTLDEGPLVKNFGDPRRINVDLPLWVLISPEGKIVHYHVGTYDIQPNEGLKELEAEVVKLVKKAREKS